LPLSAKKPLLKTCNLNPLLSGLKIQSLMNLKQSLPVISPVLKDKVSEHSDKKLSTASKSLELVSDILPKDSNLSLRVSPPICIHNVSSPMASKKCSTR
jgi:hypothetical protein